MLSGVGAGEGTHDEGLCVLSRVGAGDGTHNEGLCVC